MQNSTKQRIHRLIEAVVAGQAPSAVIEQMVLREMQPDNIKISVHAEGDDLVFVGEDGQMIAPGANASIDQIRAFLAKSREIAAELHRPEEFLDQVDGYEGTVQDLWTKCQHLFGRMNSTTYALDPELDDFQRLTMPRWYDRSQLTRLEAKPRRTWGEKRGR